MSKRNWIKDLAIAGALAGVMLWSTAHDAKAEEPVTMARLISAVRQDSAKIASLAGAAQLPSPFAENILELSAYQAMAIALNKGGIDDCRTAQTIRTGFSKYRPVMQAEVPMREGWVAAADDHVALVCRNRVGA